VARKFDNQKQSAVAHIVAVADTLVEVNRILQSWPTVKILRFREWLKENKDSDNVPWEVI
jgi:hypothetical protein